MAVNPITIKRFNDQLVDMIIYFMDRENLSLLEAYIKVSQMASSDEVIELAKAKVNTLNGVKESN